MLTAALLLKYRPEEIVLECRDFMSTIQKQQLKGHHKIGGVRCALSCSKGKTGHQWKWFGYQIEKELLTVKERQPGQCVP